MPKKNRMQMQKKPKLSTDQILSPEQIANIKAIYKRLNRTRDGKIEQPLTQLSPGLRINQYTCEECGGVITTIDRDQGVTPMFLNCRATEGCTGRSVSSMYRVPPGLEPDHEWYKPDKLPSDPGMRQHVKMGGLLIRKIKS
jgi:hypothetical protein